MFISENIALIIQLLYAQSYKFPKYTKTFNKSYKSLLTKQKKLSTPFAVFRYSVAK